MTVRSALSIIYRFSSALAVALFSAWGMYICLVLPEQDFRLSIALPLGAASAAAGTLALARQHRALAREHRVLVRRRERARRWAEEPTVALPIYVRPAATTFVSLRNTAEDRLRMALRLDLEAPSGDVTHGVCTP